MQTTATVTSKGQVTIPKTIREAFGLEQKDRLVFTIVSKDLISVKPLKKSFLDFGGSVSPKQRPENFEKVRKITMKRVANKVVNQGK